MVQIIPRVILTFPSTISTETDMKTRVKTPDHKRDVYNTNKNSNKYSILLIRTAFVSVNKTISKSIWT